MTDMRNTRSRHIEAFLMARCAPDILRARLFARSAAKEISESMAAYWAAREWLPVRLDDRSVLLVVVGDGGTPRTAGLFAYMSAWDCHSIDPAIKRTEWPVQRLTIHPQRIQDVEIDTAAHPGPLVIVCPHSHAPLDAVLRALPAPPAGRHLVALPCCVPHEIPSHEPVLCYSDLECWSAQRHVRIWHNV